MMMKDHFSILHQYLNGIGFGDWVTGAPARIAGGGALAGIDRIESCCAAT